MKIGNYSFKCFGKWFCSLICDFFVQVHRSKFKFKLFVTTSFHTHTHTHNQLDFYVSKLCFVRLHFMIYCFLFSIFHNFLVRYQFPTFDKVKWFSIISPLHGSFPVCVHFLCVNYVNELSSKILYFWLVFCVAFLWLIISRCSNAYALTSARCSASYCKERNSCTCVLHSP